MSLLMKVGMDVDLPSAGEIEDEIEAICRYSAGVSRSSISIDLPKSDGSIDKARRAVADVARKHGATIVNEIRRSDYVDFKLSKPIARDSMAMDFSYKNNYTRFVVRPDMRKPCIYSGWEYESDAKDALKEMKEGGKSAKIVSRRTLEQSGIDPNNGDNWVKGLF